ncbi:MAG: DUF559 domain-containing protein [Bacillota bacterium]|nr:DUF559 domain-containing protein [Bacillota bacterium]
MKRYLSHHSALGFWAFPLAHQYYSAEIREAGQNQFTVFDRSDRVMVDGVSSYLCSQPMPRNAVCTVEGKHVVSPQLMYLQLVQKLGLHEAILLGDLLCACPESSWMKPIMTRAELLAFAQAAEDVKGRPLALRALKYVKEDARSIMECFVDMLLALPNRHGGLGLSGGVFNYRIELDREGQLALRQRVCFVDYCFPERRIIYEYNGGHHATTIDEDSRRTLALQRQGYTVITVTKTQLYNRDALHQLLQHVAEVHQLRIRIRTKHYEEGIRAIQALLP